MKEDVLKRFGRVKAGYEHKNRSTIKKPKSASLWFDDGVVKKKLENNISFALAQTLKTSYIKKGYNPSYLKVKYST